MSQKTLSIKQSLRCKYTKNFWDKQIFFEIFSVRAIDETRTRKPHTLGKWNSTIELLSHNIFLIAGLKDLNFCFLPFLVSVLPLDEIPSYHSLVYRIKLLL